MSMCVPARCPHQILENLETVVTLVKGKTGRSTHLKWGLTSFLSASLYDDGGVTIPSLDFQPASHINLTHAASVGLESHPHLVKILDSHYPRFTLPNCSDRMDSR